MRLTILAVVLFAASNHAHAIEMCSGGNRAERKLTCLVDGDTGWENGVKWRLLDIDTPEYPAEAECPQEVPIARRATQRMQELMSSGYTIEWVHAQDDTEAKRELVNIRLPDRRNAGVVLVEEGLAVAWPHEPLVWCR